MFALWIRAHQWTSLARMQGKSRLEPLYKIDPEFVCAVSPTFVRDVARRAIPAFAAIALVLLCLAAPAQAQSFRQGVSAYHRQDYVAASRIFIPLAERGNAAAQSYLGFMFEAGRGVPQNYAEAAMWYRRAAEQGDSLAQYSLGLLYDRGQGVPRDIVEAAKWLNLATAAAPPRAREARVRIRDAVTTKMTRGEIAEARLRALQWAPSRER